jgi:hypothetical protein
LVEDPTSFTVLHTGKLFAAVSAKPANKKTARNKHQDDDGDNYCSMFLQNFASSAAGETKESVLSYK